VLTCIAFFIQRNFVVQSIIWSAGPHVQLVFLLKIHTVVIAAILNEGGAVGHNFERDPPRDHPCQVWFNLVQQFLRRRFKCESLRRTVSRFIPIMQIRHILIKDHISIFSFETAEPNYTKPGIILTYTKAAMVN
jgi:hypothetical protein